MGKRRVLIDGSLLVIESLAQAGADVFIGYPITPSNLLYKYATERFPLSFAGQDEITVLQWMSGFSATGKFSVTATSFPGFALMLESINMAYMMELPMLIILVQRLGPSSGTATCGAQGDLSLVTGAISGGFPLPVFSISNMEECWTLPPRAMEVALVLRTPVVLLTSKEMMMTQKSFDLEKLPPIEKREKKFYDGEEMYFPYKPDENRVPPFLPVGNDRFQVRFTASTHNQAGILKDIKDEEALRNTLRLKEKVEANLSNYTYYDYEDNGGDILLISYGISSLATQDAYLALKAKGMGVSLLLPKTLFPVPEVYREIVQKYSKIFMVEENLDGQYANLLFGKLSSQQVYRINSFGRMITPTYIIEEVERVINYGK